MKKLFLVIKNIFLKRYIIIFTSICLLLLSNLIAFTVFRSLASTFEGSKYVSSLSNSHQILGNLDEDNDFEKLGSLDAEKSNAIINYLNEELDYGINFNGGGTDFSIDNINAALYMYNKKSFAFQHLPVIEGTTFDEIDFNREQKEVLVGHAIGRKTPIGSEITITNPLTQASETVTAVGILDQNLYIPNNYALDSKEYLNYAIIYPLSDKLPTDIPSGILIEGLGNIILDDNDQVIKNLQSFLSDTAGINLNFFTQESNNGDFYDFYIQNIIQMLLVSGIILIMMLIVMIWNALISFRLMIKEITIHMMVGLSYQDFKRALFIFNSLISVTSLCCLYILIAMNRLNGMSMEMPSSITINSLGLIGIDWIGIALVVLINLFIVFIETNIIVHKIKKIPISIGVLS